MSYALAAVAAILFLYGLMSKRLATTPITGPIVFVTLGLLVGPAVADVVDVHVGHEAVTLVVEATLALVLFVDATRIDLPRLRGEAQIPVRLLGVSLPLTIVLGIAIAVGLFGQLDFWEAALIAAMLAPTDAALGAAVVSNPRVPSPVRQGLNVESGLNDGIAFPLVTIFLAFASAEQAGGGAFWLEFAVKQIGIAVGIGLGVGALGGRLVSVFAGRDWMLGPWRGLATLAVPVVAYGLSVPLGGSGFVATFTAGVVFGWLARDQLPSAGIYSESTGDLLTMLTFLLFGALIGPELGKMTWEMLVYALLSLTVIRMLPVAVSLLGSGNRPQTLAFIGWFGPRGLASILFALIVIEEGDLAGLDTIRLTVFLTVLISVYAHGLSATPLSNRYARWYQALQKEEPEIAEHRQVHEHRLPRPWGPRRQDSDTEMS